LTTRKTKFGCIEKGSFKNICCRKYRLRGNSKVLGMKERTEGNLRSVRGWKN
jgi:hypothetical protein